MHSDTLPIIPSANPSWKIAIIHASYYPGEVAAMVKSAKDALLAAGVPGNNISVHAVHGSFEIPLMGSVMAQKQEVDALIGIGVIVEGETEHGNLIAEATAHGIMDVQVRFGMPFAFEVLYVKSLKDAQARANKGAEAAAAVLASLAVKGAL